MSLSDERKTLLVGRGNHEGGCEEADCVERPGGDHDSRNDRVVSLVRDAMSRLLRGLELVGLAVLLVLLLPLVVLDIAWNLVFGRR